MPHSTFDSVSATVYCEDINILRSTGRLSSVRWCPSPNYGPRPEGTAISLLVVHNISLPPGQFGGGYIEDFFTNRLESADDPYFLTIADLHVSAHALIERDGTVVQFVSLLERAWHAGRSCFQGVEECNDFSVGIELEGADNVPYTPQQYRALADLALVISSAWPAISSDRITGHCDIAPGRKTDPGPAFDWPGFRALFQKRQSVVLRDKQTQKGAL